MLRTLSLTILLPFNWRGNCSSLSVLLMYEWRRSRIARAVLNYLRKFPEAQDTLGGIAEWWLTDENVRSHPTILRGVLNELVARGFILQLKGQDSQVHYRMNRRKRR